VIAFLNPKNGLVWVTLLTICKEAGPAQGKTRGPNHRGRRTNFFVSSGRRRNLSHTQSPPGQFLEPLNTQRGGAATKEIEPRMHTDKRGFQGRLSSASVRQGGAAAPPKNQGRPGFFGSAVVPTATIGVPPADPSSPKLFSILQICFFCINPISPLYFQAYFDVQPPIFAQKILPTVRSVIFPTYAIMRPMNAEPLITGHYKEDYSRRDAENAERTLNFNPLPFSAPSATLRAKFFALWRLRLCVERSSYPRLSASIRGSIPLVAAGRAAPARKNHLDVMGLILMLRNITAP
jgi:hypothetical protein